MKQKKFVSLMLIVALLATLLAGCGAKSMNTAAGAPQARAEKLQVETMAATEMAMDNGALTEEAGGGETSLPESRKWIVTVDMEAETEDLDAMTAALDGKIAALGGYLENQNVYNGSAYDGRRYRSASLTVRVPAETVDQFTEALAGISNVVRKEKNLEDVTLQYVDTESRKKALEVEQERLLELLAKAETMSDLLEIEGRLTDVRGELERTASRLKLYDNQIDYATIYLNISEVQEYTPVEEPTFWQRVSQGFTGSLKGLGESLKDLLVLLTVSLPYVLVYGGIVMGIVVLVRGIRKKHPRKAKKSQPWQGPQEPQEPKP